MLDARGGPVLEPLRAEVFGIARFEEHGRHLGASHDAGKAPFGRSTFYPRLQSNIRALRASYHYIFDTPHDEHPVSPAAEWLSDNFHLIESQLKQIRAGLPPRYYRSLPLLQNAPLAGLPRVYGVAWSFVAHTDSAFDESLLVHFLNAYQGERELSQGELWALPTTLRVVLIENLRRLAERLASHKAAQELASLCATHCKDLTLPALDAARASLDRRGVGPVFLVHLAQAMAGRRALGGQTQALLPVQVWLQAAVPDLVALQTRQQIDQAADQLSMGNAVTALRLIGAADWSDIIGETSLVLRVMLQSPVFAAEDESTRNTTLHGIERLSARSGRGEAAVAQALLALMTGATEAAALAGNWLQGAGRAQLEQTLGARRHSTDAVAVWRSAAALSRVPFYLGALLVGTLGLLAWLVAPLWGSTAWQNADALHWLGAGVVAALLLFPLSEIVVAVVNRLIGESVKPTYMPRYLLPSGIPPSARTLVAIPAMLSSTGTVTRLVHRLHLHYLANPEPHAQFALLTDGVDAHTADLPDDAALLAHAQRLVQALNAQHPADAGAPLRFVLLHRARLFSRTQQQWIGWERKRGKLEQLVAALATGEQGAFCDLGDLSQLAPHTRYVLTLDSDTQLPPGRLRSLVGVAEHPENQPRLDASGQRVVQGYGILQPRVLAPLPAHATTSLWQWLFAGQQGLDPYSAMTSDVYQDFFAEGSFTGKGLLHVTTVHAVLGGRLPEDQVLSHDLLEGALARCAVVSDVTLVEAEPEHSDTAASRLHRWTRGDWQLWPFLRHARRWGIGPIHRWKLLDNLRRSLVAPASLLLTVLAFMGVGLPLTTTLAVVVAAYTAAPLMGALAGWVPNRWGQVGARFVHEASVDLLRALATGVWHLALLPQQAWLLGDAVVRTVYRQVANRRRLLEWITAEAAQNTLSTSLRATLRRHLIAPVLAVACALALWGWGQNPEGRALALLMAAWPVLVLWALAPLLVWCANLTRRGADTQPLAPEDRVLLEGVARDTWRLFERCVDAQNHHLPPDNLQTAPYEILARRTSPTNIGLYLLSTACARQFGWIGTEELLDRMEATLATLRTMERHRGHFLNWYDTETALPLHPRYVSTVDSGNLCAHLVAVAQACCALAQHPLDPQAGALASRASLARLQPRLSALALGVMGRVPHPALSHLLGMRTPAADQLEDAAAFRALIEQAQDELRHMALPHNPAVVHTPPTERDELLWLLADHLSTLQSADRDAVAVLQGGAAAASDRLMALAEAFDALAWQADFRFLYHAKRHLLHIGYRLDDQQLDASFYDLLASESRTTSLFAMAKGDLPMRHWPALGRPFFANGFHAVLRSWSGSMFEYLMPTLVMAEPYDSALSEAGRSALREHTAFVQCMKVEMGLQGSIPWGISECAYAGRDHTLAYQYAPQGVPRLALRRAPVGELVIAPYATALATQVDVGAACANFRALAKLSARGRYGFYEALDFTPERQTHGEKFTRVSTYMAHHQGMTIVALANVLLGGVAQRWGVAHARIEAMLPLLQERAPRELPALVVTPPRLLPHARQQKTPDHVRPVVPGAQALEPTHLLSNGRYSVTLRANGAGWSRWHQTGISRWRDDALRDAQGSFLYVRQQDSSVPVSITSHPAPDSRAVYHSIFHTDRVCFDALWPGLKAHTTVWVSPEDDIELRKVVVSNLGNEVIELELISALDITLATHAADEAHPAFSNLFVQAEWLPAQQALRFVRTPRLQTETTLQAAHFVASAEGQVLGLRCQTDRLLWLGRNHTPAQPLAALNRVPDVLTTLDTGLDPVAALGVMLRIAPGAQACVTFATAASQDPGTLSAIIDKYRQPTYLERASAMSATLASIQWASQRPHRDYLPALQALTTALVMTLPKLDGLNGSLLATPLAPHRVCDRRVLWQLGISGDRPLVLVMAGSPQGMGLLRTMAQALREWAHGGVACDMVVLSTEAHSYQMPLQRELTLLREHHDANLQTHSGPAVTSFRVLRLDELSVHQLGTFASLARITLQANGQPLMHQVKAWIAEQGASMATPWRGGATDEVRTYQSSTRVLAPEGRFAPVTGTFGFDVATGLRPPKPWVNVLANPHMGAQVSETGAGNTWALNSRLNQLTAWSNDPVADPPAEWLLLQDRRTRDVWSLSPSAWGAGDAVYHVEHAQGTTTISHRRGALEVVVRWCVDPVTAIKQVHVVVRNLGGRRAHLRLVGMAEWMMGEKRGDRATLATAPCFAPLPDGRLLGLLCTQTEEAAGFGGGTAIFCESSAGPGTDDRVNESLDWTCDRREFFDARGDLVLPLQMAQRSGFGLDPCAAVSRMVTLRAGASFERVYLMGYAPTETAARKLMSGALGVAASAREAATTAHWNALLGATQVTTPDPLFDVMVNHWLLYQTVASRLYAKAGFYQAGGATGYRDQLQDTMALTWAQPGALRAQIVLCASRQFDAGDVQHWWHSPGGAGVRTHFSDDLLWLPFACAHYLQRTADSALLNELVPFLEGSSIPEGAEDVYETPRTSAATASVYEHAARAIDHSLRTGVHGLPLMGGGDWNDGMNRVGDGGRGESVWLAWFLCAIVTDWIPLARQHGDLARVQRWDAALTGWRAALATEAWDGAWYKRAFFDDGTPLGTHTRGEGRIDLIAQAWAVLSGVASPERQRLAMAAVEAHLVDAQAGLIQLLAPALRHAEPSAGYIQAYPPGVRENGGQYAHGGVWALMAAAALAGQTSGGDDAEALGDVPYRYFTYLSPAHRAQHAVWGRAYGVEPYVMAADTYSQPPYVGRGGWSWYTGAAGWLHRAAVESIMGLQMCAHELFFTPCLPSHWPGAEISLTRAGRTLRFILVRMAASEWESNRRPDKIVAGASWLHIGQRLRWADVSVDSCFVVPIGISATGTEPDIERAVGVAVR
ncbi:MAG: carbohydrate-binding protein [Gammaproteobacteria bacterium]|nr:carbohydrate-binding protein [Gammaproteobacteria bacterium]MBU1506279.1 carbohydrate-binding protein [Gammaproteobacteria bacterium]MBU2169324.1 carbohydrate-binding protein [Gammaproteobacteria bacterium]MBU2201476.1 carbohydrate-binding protein [Gammaproteobacteria bacterium]MBU2274903.1 carbohydrate-binding protein [Gammaproteobacteria bacterium]